MERIRIGIREFTILYPELIPPLSASEYADLRASITERGVEVAVVVDEDDGLIDGIHRLRIASEIGLKEVPITIRGGLDEVGKRALAVTLNRDRRQLSLEAMQVLRELRIARIAEMRQGGMSQRQIAEEVGVSEKQVREDLKKATAEGSAVEPPEGKVTGRDGRTRTATPKKHKGASTADKAAERLARQQANGTPHREPGDEEEPLTDQEGREVPEVAIPAFRQAGELNAVCRQIDDLVKEVERLGKSPVGFHLHFQSVQTHLKNAKNGLWTARPTHVCPYCKGRKKTCDACRGSGWVTSSTYKAAPEETKKS